MMVTNHRVFAKETLEKEFGNGEILFVQPNETLECEDFYFSHQLRTLFALKVFHLLA